MCPSHGASSPKVRAAARRRLDEDRARAMVGRLLHDVDAEPITDPYAELLRFGGIMRNAVDVAGARLNALESLRFTDDKGAEQMRSEATLWREIAREARTAMTDIARLDIETRHLRLEARKTAAVLAVLEAGVASADLTEAQEWSLRSAVADGLRALESPRPVATARLS